MVQTVQTVAEKIRYLRLRAGLNRVQFTKHLGLKSRITSLHWESGRRRPNLAHCYKLLALAKSVDIDWTLEDFMPEK